jgi:hypothetical protein
LQAHFQHIRPLPASHLRAEQGCFHYRNSVVFEPFNFDPNWPVLIRPLTHKVSPLSEVPGPDLGNYFSVISGALFCALDGDADGKLILVMKLALIVAPVVASYSPTVPLLGFVPKFCTHNDASFDLAGLLLVEWCHKHRWTKIVSMVVDQWF